MCIVDRPVADNSPTSRVVRSIRPSTEGTQLAGTDSVCSTSREVGVEFPFSVFPRVAKINFVHDCSVYVRLSPLQYTDVFVNGQRCRALNDSGAQLSLISQAVCDRVKAEVCGHIQLQGVTPSVLHWLMLSLTHVMDQTLVVKLWARKAFTLGVE